MNNFERILFVLIALLLISCSNNDDSNGPLQGGDGDGDGGSALLISSVKGTESFDDGDQYIYENGLLKYIYLHNCTGQLRYFEYENNKVSVEYVANYIYDFDLADFDLQSFIEVATLKTYHYENGLLKSWEIDSEGRLTQFEYDSNSKLVGIMEYIDGIGIWSNITMEYQNDLLSSLRKIEYNTTGAIASDNIYIFQFDEKVNPYFYLNERFGMINLRTCRGFDFISSMDQGFLIFQNNATKVFQDGVQIYSAEYEYNVDNYPIRMDYTYMLSGNSDVLSIQY